MIWWRQLCFLVTATFEGRVNPDVRANYLASPPLVVAYALAGSLNVNLTTDPLGFDKNGRPVYLKDIWPDAKAVADFVRKNVTRKAFAKRYKDVFNGDAAWRKIKVTKGLTYAWDEKSTYVASPPYFTGMSMTPAPVTNVADARVLGLFLELDYDGPYFPGGRHQGEFAGGPVFERARG